MKFTSANLTQKIQSTFTAMDCHVINFAFFRTTFVAQYIKHIHVGQVKTQNIII